MSFINIINSLGFSVCLWRLSVHTCLYVSTILVKFSEKLPKMADSLKWSWKEIFQNSSRALFLSLVFLKIFCFWFISAYLSLWHSIIFSIIILSHIFLALFDWCLDLIWNSDFTLNFIWSLWTLCFQEDLILLSNHNFYFSFYFLSIDSNNSLFPTITNQANLDHTILSTWQSLLQENSVEINENQPNEKAKAIYL